MIKRPQKRIQLPDDWWVHLNFLCRDLWDDSKATNSRMHSRLDIYEFTSISRRSFSTARTENEMTEKLFLKLTEAVGYKSKDDLLHDLGLKQGAPLDLAPPTLGKHQTRPRCATNLQELVDSYLTVIIQGPPNSGKRSLALELTRGLVNKDREMNLFWYTVLQDAALGDLTERLKNLSRPLITRPGKEILDLISWLQTENIVLVLEGIGLKNVNSFAPLIQQSARISGPARLIATSNIRLNGENIYVVPALLPEELAELLYGLGVETNDKKLGEFVSQVECWPNTVDKALRLFGNLDSSTLSQASKIYQDELINQLSPMDRRLVEVLYVIGIDFDLTVLQEIFDFFGIEEIPIAVVNRLHSLFLLKQVSENNWHLCLSDFPGRNILNIEAELVGLLKRLSCLYEARAFRPDRPRNPRSIDDLTNLYNACRLLQIANVDPFQRQRLIEFISSSMESFGLHDRLRVLYEFEVNAKRDVIKWINFKYARSLHVTGQLKAMLNVCDEAFHHFSRHKSGRDESLYVSFLRQLSQLFDDLGHGEIALRVLDAALETAETAELSATVGVQTVSMLGWVLLRAGMVDDYQDLRNRVLRRPFGNLTQPFSQALSQVNEGIAYLYLDKCDEAIANLEFAGEYFSNVDARAYSWSELHLALAFRKSSKVTEAKRALLKSIKKSASCNFFRPDMSSAYLTFLADEVYQEVHADLKLELARLDAYEEERSTLALSIVESRLVEHIFLEHGVELGIKFVYDPGKYELFSEDRPYPIRSKFNQDLINRIRKENAEETLDVLFSERKPHHIFRVHLYNRIIANACTDTPLLANKFLYPYITTILEQIDSVLFVYARHFEDVHSDVEIAQLLLSSVRNRDCFNYYNISANCKSKEDFEKAMRLNELALSYAKVRQQRSQIQNNMASLIFNHRKRSRFSEAISLCEEAIKNTNKANFHWPKNLLLKLKLLECESEDCITEILNKHQQRFNVSISSLRSICSEFNAGRVKRLSLNVLNTKKGVN